MLPPFPSPRAARRALVLAALAACLVALPWLAASPTAQSDLDAFMQEAMSKRDTNWQKLQQYVLDERELVEMRGPSGALLWGERRDYAWYIRDGFFVRSPLKVNGSAVGEPDRLKYEADFLRRAQEREARVPIAGPDGGAAPGPGSASDDVPRDVDGLIRQSRQPQFISSAYFFRFKFDQGRYALVGREKLEEQDVLRIEYYPQNLFTEEQRRERREEYGRGRPDNRSDDTKALSAELMRLMNTQSRITLWIAPASHQILKYTFDELDWNFFPGQWLAQMDGVSASMTMGQPFPDVWLPRGLEMRIGLAMAFGHVDLRYTLDYENYRQADVRTKVVIPDRP